MGTESGVPLVDWLCGACPDARDKHRRTSDRTPKYNCIAYAAGESHRWWEPGGGENAYWPVDNGDYTVAGLTRAYEAVGFVDCGMDSKVEAGFDKVAIYADANGYTHAARLDSAGKWHSKLGRLEDIVHDTAECLQAKYGFVVKYMKRPSAKSSPAE